MEEKGEGEQEEWDMEVVVEEEKCAGEYVGEAVDPPVAARFQPDGEGGG